MRTILTALALFLLACASAYAQDPPSIGYYSLTVDYAEEVYGEGVIADGGMPNEIHTYNMSTSLYSPSGREAWGSTTTGRISVRLPIGEDHGNYRISTTHWVWCTYYGILLAGVQSTATVNVRRFLITARSFIPELWVPTPDFCWNSERGDFFRLTYKGDDRYYSDAADASIRSSTRALVDPSSGRLLGQLHQAGVSKSYAIVLEDDEPQNDCFKLHQASPGDPSRLRASASTIATRTVRARLYGGAGSTGAPLPDIDWEFTLDLSNFNPASPGFTMQPGSHDCYPAYEVYLNRRQGIYGYMPPRRDWIYLRGCLARFPESQYPAVTFGPYSGPIN